jgi:quinohemoprotein ethanol dehydrogenase
MIKGNRQRVAMTVPKSRIFYVLDAKTGRLISSKRLDGNEADAAAGPGRRPGPGHNWWPMAYNIATGLVYVPASDVRTGELAPGQNRSQGRLVAWDPVRQSARWSVEQPLETNGGVLSTAGNLVFHGEGTGEFAAYAADTGHKVWSSQSPRRTRSRSRTSVTISTGALASKTTLRACQSRFFTWSARITPAILPPGGNWTSNG